MRASRKKTLIRALLWVALERRNPRIPNRIHATTALGRFVPTALGLSRSVL
jgi:hypothetical protein